MSVVVVPTSADRTEFNRKASKLRLAQLKNTTLSAPKVGISFADKLKYLRQSYQIAQSRSEEVINSSENSALKGHEQAILKVYGALSTLLFASICGSSTTIEELETFIRKSVAQIPTAEFDFYGEWQLVMNVAKECRQQGSKSQAALPIYQRKMKLFQYAANNSVKLMKNELILLKNDVLQSLQEMNMEMFELFNHIQAIAPSAGASGNGHRPLLPDLTVQRIVEAPKPAVIKTNKSVQTDVVPSPKVVPAAPVAIPVTPKIQPIVTPTNGSSSAKVDESVVIQCNQRLESVMELVNSCLTSNDDHIERERLQSRIDELQSRLVTVDKLIVELEASNASLQKETMTSLKTLQDTPVPEPVVMVVESAPRKRSSTDLLQAQQSLQQLIAGYDQKYQQQWSTIERSLKNTESRLNKVNGLWKGVSYDKLTANLLSRKLVSDSQIESLVKEINDVYASSAAATAAASLAAGEVKDGGTVAKPTRTPSGRPLSGKSLTEPESVIKVQSIIRGFLGRVRVKKIHTIIAASEQGVLVAYSGTKQGETGWYIAQDQLFYFICHNGEFLLMCGPVSKDIYDIAREELNASPRFALRETNKEKLPINMMVDRHGLHATRIQIETLLDDLKTRDSLIEQLYEDIGYLQEMNNQAQNFKMTHQHESVLLRRQVLECQGTVEMLTKEKQKLLNKDAVDSFQKRLNGLVENSSRINMRSFTRLSSAVRGYIGRSRVKKMKLFRQAHETGVLVAMKNTVQGESGWYVGPNGTIFYFVLKNGEWIHTAGPIYEKDFQFMRTITKLRVPLVEGEILSRCPFRLAESHAEMFEQGDLFVSNHNDKLYLALPIDILMPSIQEPMELSVSAVSSISKPDDTADNLDNGSLADSLQ